MRKPEYCLYCGKWFQPPDVPYNESDNPLSKPGWMVAYCSRDCAALDMPHVWPEGVTWAHGDPY